MTGNSRLRVDQFPPHGVHRNPVERFVERRQEPDDCEVGLLAKDVQRPGAVLAGTPGEQDVLSWNGHHHFSGALVRWSLPGDKGLLT